jgi:hypothetical protein
VTLEAMNNNDNIQRLWKSSFKNYAALPQEKNKSSDLACSLSAVGTEMK